MLYCLRHIYLWNPIVDSFLFNTFQEAEICEGVSPEPGKKSRVLLADFCLIFVLIVMRH